IVTSTSARRRALVPNKPPNPDPITTTWWRRSVVAMGVLLVVEFVGTIVPRPRIGRLIEGGVSCVTLTITRARHGASPRKTVSGGPILGKRATFAVTSARSHRRRRDVPLNRPALALEPGPRSVQDARRWVVSTCTDIGRGDLVECAELGSSELVTNALLHGTPPISIRVRGTREHPRVEVRDTSIEPPELPTTTDVRDEADLLLTFGRGLSIVARAADAWGVDVEEDGKTVWFAPARAFA